MCKTRRLAKEVGFWARMAKTFSKAMTNEERRVFNNLFETDFKSFVEKHLEKLVDDIKNERVDMKLSLEQGMCFVTIIKCRFINKDLREELGSLFYPDFAKQVVDQIKNNEISKISFEEGMSLQDLVDNEEVDQELRNKLRKAFLPIFVNQLIEDIQSGVIDRDSISIGDFNRLKTIIDSDIDPELCSRLSSVIYGADERG